METRDYNNEINQKIKGKFVEREVHAMVTPMVEYILNKSYEDPDAPFSFDDIENLFIQVENDEDEEYEEEMQEIFEWYLVSSFLIDDLAEKGEPVIRHENLWGRTCTGQAVLLDHVISEICEEKEILHEQKYDWTKQ